MPYINMHLPQVYMCSPSWTPLPPPSPYHPSGSSQCTSPKLPVSCIEPGLEIRFWYDIVHVFHYMLVPNNKNNGRAHVKSELPFHLKISPSNAYSGLISFRLTGLISLPSKGLSRVFSNTTVQKHQFFDAQPSLWFNSHIHTWLLEKPYPWLDGPL